MSKLFPIGSHMKNLQYLNDHYPPETFMIMKPSMNPNMAPNVGISVSSTIYSETLRVFERIFFG
jgi:hypothetical protein